MCFDAIVGKPPLKEGPSAFVPVRVARIELALDDYVCGPDSCEFVQLSEHYSAYSARRIFAPATIDFILSKATSRGRYFMPQSGARITFSGLT